MLFRLAYYSTKLIKKSTSPRLSELRKIILSAGSSRAGNKRGLMFNGDYFGQVLEGDRASVSDLFCQIARGPRHRSVVIVEASAVAERRFDRWAMGLAEKNETAETLNAKFGFERGVDPTQISGSDFSNYFYEMVSLEDQLISVSIPAWERKAPPSVQLV